MIESPAASGKFLAAGFDRASAFAVVYATEHDRLVRTAALLLGSSAMAEDLVQDAFAKLHVRWNQVDTPEAWLRTVVVHGARNELRRARVRRRLAFTVAGRSEAPQDPPRHELIESLRRLPLRQRAVVVLRFYEDRPEADIARILGMPLGTVKSTLRRALTTLRGDVER